MAVERARAQRMLRHCIIVFPPVHTEFNRIAIFGMLVLLPPLQRYGAFPGGRTSHKPRN